MLSKICRLAQLHYEGGAFQECDNILNLIKAVAADQGKHIQVQYGRFHCCILLGNINECFAIAQRISQFIDATPASKDSKDFYLETSIQRCKLLYSCLFVDFSAGHLTRKDNPEQPQQSHFSSLVCELLSNNLNVAAIQYLCPGFYRYFVSAVILYNRRRDTLKMVLRNLVMMDKNRLGRDSIVEYFMQLQETYDFKKASSELLTRVYPVVNRLFFYW